MQNPIQRRELAKASPRARLVQIVKVVEAVSVASGGRASIPELADSLTRCFDPEMMLYVGFGSGLAEAIDGNPLDEHSGYNKRADIACEIFNSGYWKESEYRRPVMFGYSDPLDAEDVLVSRFDGERLAHKLWNDFFNHPDDIDVPVELFPNDAYLAHLNTKQQSKATPIAEQSPPPPKPQNVTTVARWPWGSHHTEMLGHLEAAALRFWVNVDPSDNTTAPTNKEVSDWLEKERKVSNAGAKAIASILRQDDLPTGPRK